MFKPEELVPTEVWRVVLFKLSLEDKLTCRYVCVSFKKEVDSILNKNQDRLWVRHYKYRYVDYFWFDKDQTMSPRDTLCFGRTICIQKLEFVSALMPSLKILQLDHLHQVCREESNKNRACYYDFGTPNYRDKKGKAVPITNIFPQVACFILPGQSEKNNFIGDLSQVKHLTLCNGVLEEVPTFPNLESLEARTWRYTSIVGLEADVPVASKTFVLPDATTEWRTLPKTLEVIETGLNFDEYISVGKPHFSNLRILKGGYGENRETLINFLEDHKGSLTELSFSIGEEVANIHVVLSLLTNLQKLSVEIETDKQAIELKDIKALAHNLQYFELKFFILPGTEKHLDLILENLPIGLDNLEIKGVNRNEEIEGVSSYSYEEIDTFLEKIMEKITEKIMEKIINGDTKRVTIAGVHSFIRKKADNIMKQIVKMKPSPVRVEGTKRVFEHRSDSPGTRTEHFSFIWDIAMYLQM